MVVVEGFLFRFLLFDLGRVAFRFPLLTFTIYYSLSLFTIDFSLTHTQLLLITFPLDFHLLFSLLIFTDYSSLSLSILDSHLSLLTFTYCYSLSLITLHFSLSLLPLHHHQPLKKSSLKHISTPHASSQTYQAKQVLHNTISPSHLGTYHTRSRRGTVYHIASALNKVLPGILGMCMCHVQGSRAVAVNFARAYVCILCMYVHVVFM